MDFGPENAGMLVKRDTAGAKIGYFRRFDVGWSFSNLFETVEQTLSVDWDHPEGGVYDNYIRYWAAYDLATARSMEDVFKTVAEGATQHVLIGALENAQERISALKLNLQSLKETRLKEVFTGDDANIMGWLQERLLARMQSFEKLTPPLASPKLAPKVANAGAGASTQNMEEESNRKSATEDLLMFLQQ